MTSRFGPEKLKRQNCYFLRWGRQPEKQTVCGSVVVVVAWEGGVFCLFVCFLLRGWGRNSILDILTLKCLVDILAEF